jgi:hypothetical protein
MVLRGMQIAMMMSGVIRNLTNSGKNISKCPKETLHRTSEGRPIFLCNLDDETKAFGAYDASGMSRIPHGWS